MRIGFLGLGKMGTLMALRLIAADWAVGVYPMSQQRREGSL
jgi:3-hydroxyisobutyrate dehydrogenase-like beta-hydroxyacid dehydrogenase